MNAQVDVPREIAPVDPLSLRERAGVREGCLPTIPVGGSVDNVFTHP